MNKKNVVVLGAKGMLGRAVYGYLKEKYPNNVWGTDKNDKNYLQLDAANPTNQFNEIVKKVGKIDYFINCIGILNKKNEKNIFRYIKQLVQVNVLHSSAFYVS